MARLIPLLLLAVFVTCLFVVAIRSNSNPREISPAETSPEKESLETPTEKKGIPEEITLEEKKIKVTILVILASETNQNVQDKLKEIAKEIQKKEPKLTGFRLEKSISVAVALDKTEKVKLCDNASVDITVNPPQEEHGNYAIKLKPPTLGEITYTCTCNKFFPIITTHVIAPNKERLILAIMTKPCLGTKP